MVSRCAIFISLFWAWWMVIVPPMAQAQVEIRSLPAVPSAFYGAASTCEHNAVESYLDVNNVRAHVLNSGRLFWKGGLPIYEVPKNSGKTSIFTAALWMAGESEGVFRAATGTYWQSEFWPGLLDEAGNPPADCTPFNRLYNVSRRDLVLYDSLGVTTADLADWPHHLGAPVIDGDGNPDNYDLAAGDRPDLLGDQSIFWVMNDAAGEHWRSNTPPLGVDIAATAGAFRSDNEALNHTTFYRYRIRYRGNAPLEKARVGLFVDAQVGSWEDDFVGADTSSLKMVYNYNGDDFDDDDSGYGAAPPAIGFSFIDGINVSADGKDNDRDGAVDERGEELRLSTFIFNDEVHEGYTGEVMQRHFEGRLVFHGDTDYILDGCTPQEGCIEGASKDTTNIMVPGDPVTVQYWSETNWWNGMPRYGGNRTLLFTMGPFDMEPGDEEEVVLAIAWARGTDYLDSVTQLKTAMADVQARWFEQNLPSTSEALPDSSPALLSPANGAIDQASSVELVWEESGAEHAYWLEWGQDPTLADAKGQLVSGALLSEGYDETFVNTRYTLADLALGATYYWRVRAVSIGGIGLASDIQMFTVGDAELRNGGPLLLSNGTPAMLEIAGPGGADPCSGANAADLGCIEYGGKQVWSDTSSAGDFKIITFHPNLLASPFTGFAPHDYEIRFTDAGSLALYSSFGDAQLAPAPFELWDVGPTDPFTPNDTSDDVQLLPVISASSEGDCKFYYEVNTVYTDWLATQRFSGEYVDGGYANWADSMATVYEAYNGLCMPLTQEQRPSYERSALFSGLRFTGNQAGPNYREEGPPVGTVVRFLTTSHGLSVPQPASPAQGAVDVLPGSYFWWNTIPEALTHIQVARDPDFTTIAVQDTLVNTQRWAVPKLIPGGMYYWRVRSAFARGPFTEWSPAWAFTLSTTVKAEEEALPFPDQLELAGNFPNPFRGHTTIQIGLSVPGHVRIEVHDLLGRRVAVLVDEVRNAGWYEVEWRAERLPSGVYFVVAQTPDARRIMKVVRVR